MATARLPGDRHSTAPNPQGDPLALYAFDGTWNKNMPKHKDDTNVRKFFEAYRSAYTGPSTANFYMDGPSTR